MVIEKRRLIWLNFCRFCPGINIAKINNFVQSELLLKRHLTFKAAYNHISVNISTYLKCESDKYLIDEQNKYKRLWYLEA